MRSANRKVGQAFLWSRFVDDRVQLQILIDQWDDRRRWVSKAVCAGFREGGMSVLYSVGVGEEESTNPQSF